MDPRLAAKIDAARKAAEARELEQEQAPLEGLEHLDSEAAELGFLPVDLARHGFWALEPGRPSDIAGTTVILTDAPLGALGTFDLEVCCALLAIAGGRPATGERITYWTARGLAERLELAYSGRTAAEISASIGRLQHASFDGRILAEPGEREGRKGYWFFSIISEAMVLERGQGRSWVEWSQFVADRLAGNAFAPVDLGTLARLRRKRLAQRLYVYAEARGAPATDCEIDELTGQRHERIARTVDTRFQATLGSRRGKPREFRRALLAAGEAIIAADPRYRSALLRRSRRTPGSFVLELERLERRPSPAKR